MASRGTFSLKRDIVAVCRRLYDRGLIAGPDGNVSVRVAPDRVLVTPAGLSKVDVQVEDLVELSLDGRHVRGDRRASSEILMHLRIYQRRPDVQAVVHAHPPTATGFSVAGESLAACVLPEVIGQMGSVPLLPYATPGTSELADSFDPFVEHHDAFLMANHGATTIGPTLTIAHQRMESLEHSARILLTARLLGNVNTLTPAQVETLIAARQRATPGTLSRMSRSVRA
ncbi:MAG: class II aldolase/adducin family protein [Gemmatimonadaceae bacterium]|nr:class II aldolase/adducin family protein [Gemmatimonadaceae bacterium]